MAEKITIARPYAQAIYDLAQEQSALKEWSEMLAVAATVAANESMVSAIDNPDISDAQLSELFLEICGETLNDTGKNMVRVLADNGRLAILPEIEVMFEELRAVAEGTIQAEVISASELNDTQKANIAEALKNRLGRDVTLECKIDESLVGGAVIRAGDMVIDGSVNGRLSKLATDLMN